MATNRFLSTMGVRQAIPIAGMAAARDGDWVSLENYAALTVMFATEVGTAGSDTKVGFMQATSNSGGSEKRVIPRRAYYASATALDAGGAFSEATIDSTGDIELIAERADLLLVEIGADELDVASGFKFVQVIHDAGGVATQLGGAWYIFGGPRYAVDPTEWPAVDA